MFEELLQGNPYFTAGFGLLGVGGGLAVLRQGMMQGLNVLRRRYLTTLDVTSREAAYPWLIRWLQRQSLMSGGHYSLKSTANQRWTLIPSPGVHFFRWSGVWWRMERERERSLLDVSGQSSPLETIRLSCVGRRPDLIGQLLSECEVSLREATVGRLQLYTPFAHEWRPFGHARRTRPLNSVILEAGISEAIMEDVNEFRSSSQWYQERGIPYRRGYLLYGPPGGGKSSFVQAVASELGWGICMLSLADGTVTDDRLHHLLMSIPERTLLLLEDIDAASTSVEKTSRVTLSGLLNALDGVAAAEERILFMTTNHVDRLDPALRRPGRIDVERYIGRVSLEQAQRMFVRFYPHASTEMVEAFLQQLKLFSQMPSPAAIQGLFIRYKLNPQSAIQNLYSDLQ